MLREIHNSFRLATTKRFDGWWFRPGELGVVVAPSGVGKTWILTALGAFVRQGLSVVHYSLELSEHYVGQRYDTHVFSKIPSANIKERKDEVREKIKSLKGNLLIKYFPPKGVSSKKVAQHIDKMIANDNKPDLIIIDYADLLLSHSNKKLILLMQSKVVFTSI